MLLLGTFITFILFTRSQKFVFVRWWRAPEILIDWERYNEKVDIWSIGCIMAELILLRPVFRGADSFDQLNRILEILGTPDTAILREICTAGLYKDSNKRIWSWRAFSPLTRSNYIYIRTFLEMFDYIVQLTPRPRQDFNQLFGFQYDTATQPPISGVSPQGIWITELRNESVAFNWSDYRCWFTWSSVIIWSTSTSNCCRSSRWTVIINPSIRFICIEIIFKSIHSLKSCTIL